MMEITASRLFGFFSNTPVFWKTWKINWNFFLSSCGFWWINKFIWDENGLRNVKSMWIGIHRLIPHQCYLYTQWKVKFFIKHYLIPPILYKGSTLINFGFFIKEDIWYAVPILDFTSLNVCITFIRPQNQSQFKKTPWSCCDNINFTKNSQSYKI